MKFSPGVVPQWPSRRGLMCSLLERLLQQRIVEQVDLADRQIVRRAPVGVDQSAFRLGQDLRAWRFPSNAWISTAAVI